MAKTHLGLSFPSFHIEKCLPNGTCRAYSGWVPAANICLHHYYCSSHSITQGLKTAPAPATAGQERQAAECNAHYLSSLRVQGPNTSSYSSSLDNTGVTAAFNPGLQLSPLGFSGWEGGSAWPGILIDWAPRPSRALGAPQINRTHTVSKTSLSSLT